MLKEDARQHFGTLTAVGKAIGISRSAVAQWPDVVPEGMAYKLQVITGGRLQVAPHLYPSRRGTRRPKPQPMVIA
jgi:hypothetical protein